jgi:hypothetical protein
MGITWIAALAFVAGFLTCAACVVAIIFWSYSDKRAHSLASRTKVWSGAQARIGEN